VPSTKGNPVAKTTAAGNEVPLRSICPENVDREVFIYNTPVFDPPSKKVTVTVLAAGVSGIE
jgi:hypothetical protein